MCPQQPGSAQHMETIFGVVLTDAMAFDVTGQDREEELGLLIPRLLEVPELRGYCAHGRDSKVELSAPYRGIGAY